MPPSSSSSSSSNRGRRKPAFGQKPGSDNQRPSNQHPSTQHRSNNTRSRSTKGYKPIHTGPSLASKAVARKPIKAEGPVRLNKVIADSGMCSRRTADTWITEGRVSVNLETVTEVGTKVTDKDIVLVDGHPLPRPKGVYAVFHKPVGVVTTRSDENNRRTIYDVLSKRFQKCDTAGRLDKDTSGVLILSTDGDFVQLVTHPKYGCQKVYRVQVNKPLTPEALKSLRTGVSIATGDEPDAKTVMATALSATQEDDVKLTMTLTTGYNRQVRRMLEALGYHVVKLKRIQVGPIKLGQLAVGKTRMLTKEELKKFDALKAKAQLKAAEKADTEAAQQAASKTAKKTSHRKTPKAAVGAKHSKPARTQSGEAKKKPSLSPPAAGKKPARQHSGKSNVKPGKNQASKGKR